MVTQYASAASINALPYNGRSPFKPTCTKLSEECSGTSYNRRSILPYTKRQLSANDEAVFLPVTAFRIIYKYSIAQ